MKVFYIYRLSTSNYPEYSKSSLSPSPSSSSPLLTNFSFLDCIYLMETDNVIAITYSSVIKCVKFRSKFFVPKHFSLSLSLSISIYLASSLAYSLLQMIFLFYATIIIMIVYPTLTRSKTSKKNLKNDAKNRLKDTYLEIGSDQKVHLNRAKRLISIDV